MPSGGLTVDDTIMEEFSKVKMKTGSLDWITLKMKGESKIILDNSFPKTEEDIAEFKADRKNKTVEENFLTRVWPGFVAEMKALAATTDAEGKKKKAEPRYAVINTFFEHKDRKQDRLLFFTFIPESSPIRGKMIMSSTKDSVIAKLDGIHVKFNFTDAAEFDWDQILSAITH